MSSRRRFLKTTAATIGALAAGRLFGQESRTEVVDMHVHFIRKLTSPQGRHPEIRDNPLLSHWTWHEHNGDLLVQEMNRAGVDRALLKTFNAEDIALSASGGFLWIGRVPVSVERRLHAGIS